MSHLGNLVTSLVLLTYVLVSNQLKKTRNTMYNEATLATLFGVAIGLFQNFYGIQQENNTLFFEIILPIIIMGANQEVDLKLFQENFSFILWYGVIGTMLNFVGLFCFIFLFFEFTKISLLQNANLLLLSATLTATDVSLLGSIKKKKFPKVHSIIFGEGLLNDAIAFILFKLTLDLNNLNDELNILDFGGLFYLMRTFFAVSFFSLLIGVFFSYLYLFTTRKIFIQKENKVPVQICLMVLFGFFTYYLAEYLNCSGTLAIFCFIIIHSNYSTRIIEKEAVVGIAYILKTASYICEAISFIYLGISSVSLLKDQHFWQTSITSVVIFMGICVIRWISVGMPALLFICYDNIKIEANEIMLIWFAGLMRGSVSAGLCMMFMGENEKLKNVVVMIAIFTTLVLSSISS